MAPSVVIVVALHQGRTHLNEQLASIRAQSRSPDLILLRDDASSDGSGEMAVRFLQESGLAYTYTRNAQRLGAVANFARGLQDARTSDVVVLCDQDDIWRRDKLAIISEAFDSHPASDLMFSDGGVIDGSSMAQSGTLWDHAGFSGRLRARWEAGDHLGVLLQQNVVTGAATAFRGSLLDRALPMPTQGWHDAWLALIAVTTGQATALTEKLIDYRIHEGNAVGLVRPSTPGQVRASLGARTHHRARLLRRELDLFTGLEHRLVQLSSHAAIPRVRAKRTLLETRLSLPSRAFARAKLLANSREAYEAYSLGATSMLNDLLRPLRADSEAR